MFLTGQLQKRGVSPDTKIQIKPVKDVSFVDLSTAHPVTNVLTVIEGIPVGSDCKNFDRS